MTKGYRKPIHCAPADSLNEDVYESWQHWSRPEFPADWWRTKSVSVQSVDNEQIWGYLTIGILTAKNFEALWSRLNIRSWVTGKENRMPSERVRRSKFPTILSSSPETRYPTKMVGRSMTAGWARNPCSRTYQTVICDRSSEMVSEAPARNGSVQFMRISQTV